MLRTYVQLALQWLNRVIHQPRSELDRWQRAARFTYDLGRHGYHQLVQDQAPQMAAALAFRALFGLVPVLVVVTILVRAMIGVDEFQRWTDRVLQSLGVDVLTVVPPTPLPPDTTPIGPDSMSVDPLGPAPTALASRARPGISLQEWLDGVIAQAATVNMAAVGWVGFVLIIYSAISLLVTIEDSFNSIYRAPEGRRWSRRVPIYWFLLTVSPLAVWLMAYLQGRLHDWTGPAEQQAWYFILLGIAWNGAIGWLLMFTVYMLVPSTTVAARPAAIGALVAVVLLGLGKQTLGAYLNNAFTVSQLYGSLGLIPLFMFWVYLMWLAVLFGLEVSATLQFLAGRRLEELETSRPTGGQLDPLAVVAVMERIAARFEEGLAATARTLSEETHLADETMQTILHELATSGLVHRLEADATAVAIARSPDTIPASQLLEIGYRLSDAGGEPLSKLLTRLREAQHALAGQFTLAGGMQPQSSSG